MPPRPILTPLGHSRSRFESPEAWPKLTANTGKMLGCGSRTSCRATQSASRISSKSNAVSAPSQPRDDGAAHDQVFVGFGEKAQLLGEMRHALAVAGLGVGIGYVGAPIAALRTVRIEQAMDMGVTSRNGYAQATSAALTTASPIRSDTLQARRDSAIVAGTIFLLTVSDDHAHMVDDERRAADAARRCGRTARSGRSSGT